MDVKKAREEAALKFVKDTFNGEPEEYVFCRREGEEVTVLRSGNSIELIGILTYVANQLSAETQGIPDIFKGVTIQ